ncbi:hypothetical protein CPC16_008228 [Podila verticillata]|nr:hypothetical protein CPC16_008228 [Podila verticillata]
MPSDAPDAPGAPPAKIDFTSALAKVKAIAAKLGTTAASSAPESAALAPTTSKRPYEDDNYGHGDDSYGKRMAYDGGRDSAPIHRPGLGAQVSHYAPPTRNEHQIQEEMGVPGNLVGLIIGRGGENLKRIERDTGCKVQFSQDGNPGDRERFVNMIGQPAGIAEAKRQIQDIINSSMSGDRFSGGPGGPPRGGGYGSGDYGMGGGGYSRGGNSQTIQIPSTKVGLVIGRGGETIRDLQDRSGARIAVTPTPHDHTSNMRTVTITGDDNAIQMAKTFIEEIVNDTAPRGGYGGGGGGFQSSPPVTMTVPQETIGLVIGRGGETVKALQIQSRAKIQVQQVDPSVPPPAERTINLFGPPEAIEYAKQLIMEKVNGARDNDRYGGRDQGGYGGGNNGGGYGGYQQYQQPAQSSSSSGGYGQQYGSYAPATAAPAAAAAAATGYTPEQQAAYAQYYGYQYGGAYPYGSTATPAATSAAPGSDAVATSSAAATDSSAYGAYDYSRYGGQYGTAAVSGAPASAATTSAASAPATGDAAPATSSDSAAAPDYSAYYAQQGYSQEAYQQYYGQYYGYQAGATSAAPSSSSAAAPSGASGEGENKEASESSSSAPALVAAASDDSAQVSEDSK